MQRSITKNSGRVIFPSQFQRLLLCVFWKSKFPPVPLSSPRKPLNQIQLDHCRAAVLDTHKVSSIFFLSGLKSAWNMLETMYIWTICHLSLKSHCQQIISAGLIHLFVILTFPLHWQQDWFSLVVEQCLNIFDPFHLYFLIFPFSTVPLVLLSLLPSLTLYPRISLSTHILLLPILTQGTKYFYAESIRYQDCFKQIRDHLFID